MSHSEQSPSALHQLMQQSLAEVVADTSANLQPGDTVLAFGSHIAAMLDEALQNRVQGLGLHLIVLQSDAEALGLITLCERHQLALINDHEWLELTLNHHPVYTY